VLALPGRVAPRPAQNLQGCRKDTLKQIYDGQKVLLESDQTNTTQVVYTSSPGVYGDLVSQKRLTVPHYHIFDPLGSSDRLTSSVQGVTDTYIYKGFGDILLAGATINPFRFVGRLGYYVDTDLNSYMVRARVLASAIGRWLSRDASVATRRASAYVYVDESPVVWTDPSGMIKVKPLTSIDDSYDCDSTPFQNYDFILEQKHDCLGYIVQRVEVRCEIDCSCSKCPNTSPVNSDYVFYEAWKVRKNEDMQWQRKLNLFPYTDQKKGLCLADCCGNLSLHGTIKFFCGEKTGDLGDFGLPTQDPKAAGWGPGQTYPKDANKYPDLHKLCFVGPLKGTSYGGPEPRWWLHPDEGPTTSSFSTYWCCCGKPDDFCKVFANPSK